MTGYTVTGPCNTRRRPCTQVSRDGLYDEDLRFGVEFNKEPRIIDDAVYYAVNFMEIRGLNRGDRQGRDRTWRAYDTDKYCPGNDDSKAQRIDNDANQERTRAIQDLLVRIERLERSNTCANPWTNRSAEVECYTCQDLGHYARDCPRRQCCMIVMSDVLYRLI